MKLFYTKLNSFLRKIKSSISGFTLLEMVIVISIMAIITAVTVGYNRGSNDKLVLFSNQAKVVGVLQRAKSFALQKKEGDGGLVCAFGVHFEQPRTMIIFRDEASSPNPGFCDDDSSNMEYDGGSEKIEEVKLDPDIGFKSLSCGEEKCDILFSTPYLDVSGKGVISLSIGDKIVKVEVGSGAQIYSR